MRAQIAYPKNCRLYIPDLDTHVLIENSADAVVITATRDNLSDRRKSFFIRHLAAEGFIPDRYEWFSEAAQDGFSGVKWIAPASSNDTQARFSWMRKIWPRRNVFYGCTFIVWLCCFVWAARHVSPGL